MSSMHMGVTDLAAHIEPPLRIGLYYIDESVL